MASHGGTHQQPPAPPAPAPAPSHHFPSPVPKDMIVGSAQGATAGAPPTQQQQHLTVSKHLHFSDTSSNASHDNISPVNSSAQLATSSHPSESTHFLPQTSSISNPVLRGIAPHPQLQQTPQSPSTSVPQQLHPKFIDDSMAMSGGQLGSAKNDVADNGDEAKGSDAKINAEEIKKLEQEFEKKLLRAKNAYGKRMESLKRSKDEAEAQHKMALEKHEKERIEFEKKGRLAEEVQNRLLNQMQKEYDEKKHQAQRERSKLPTLPNGVGAVVGAERPPLHHKRAVAAPHEPPPNPPAGSGGDSHKRSGSSLDEIPDSYPAPVTEQLQSQTAPPLVGSASSGHNVPSIPNNNKTSSDSAAGRDRSGSISS